MMRIAFVRTRTLLLPAFAAAWLFAACAGSAPAPAPSPAASPTAAGVPDRLVVRGSLTLDGAPLDAQFLGAVVQRAGLVTPCQWNIPAVARGSYEIVVMAEAEAAGCGGPGASVVLWTYVQDRKLYARTALDWPAAARVATFDAAFSLAAPGLIGDLTEVFGDAYGTDGQPLPLGTRVEAYIGDVRCGVAVTRHGDGFFGYILAVAGPEQIAGCARGAAVTFRLDGKPAAESIPNAPSPVRREPLNLTLR